MKTTGIKWLQFFIINSFLFLAIYSVQAQKIYKYQSVPNDPMNVRIYTLDNGLKVYLSVYKQTPRIYTSIAVNTGSKNDPSDNTGLSHYLEHMMFKGTGKYGTADFTRESVELNKIDSLFEVYRSYKDTVIRKRIYHQIDSVSGVAATYGIANEYDKMMGYIGATGTNAYTSNDQTVYINDIPSNQVENWLNIESERFSNPVFRIFHTELEAVYEEKNMSLDNDDEKAWDSLMTALFKYHPYGTQTTIGTVEHLKNPSLKALKKYFTDRYVPNNIAICMSGDFNPDEVIKLIDERFGKMPSKPLKSYTFNTEPVITKPLVKEAIGPNAEYMFLGYRFSNANKYTYDTLNLMSMVLYNSMAGLIDLNLNQEQKVIEAGAYCDKMDDYSLLIFYGYPKEGQKCEEVKDLLLSQIALLKKGEFPDWMLTAILNNLKKEDISSLENNDSRVGSMVGAFSDNTPWSDECNYIQRLSKITKQDIIAFANKYLNDNYAVVYKRTGEEQNVKKISKPGLTPVSMNRDSQSEFVKSVVDFKAKAIEPVFIDYSKDMSVDNFNSSIPILYKKNDENASFELFYVFDMGKNNNLKLPLAVNYLDYLGTSDMTPAQFKQEMYKIGCSFKVFSSNDQVYVSLYGLNENFEKGMNLFEKLLADPKPDKAVWENQVSDILKMREDDKLSQNAILWSGLYNYGLYGAKSPFTDILSKKELQSVKPEELTSLIKELNSYKHNILYYGPLTTDSLKLVVKKYHKAPETPKAILPETNYPQLETSENKVFVVDYKMKQAEIIMLSKSVTFDKAMVPDINLFNEYFGGSMYSVSFQELRESKALAYSAYSMYTMARRKDKANYIFSYIGTQADKLGDAMSAMTEILNNMPEAQKSFDASKTAIIEKLRTERINRSDVLFNYLLLQKLGINYDIRKDVYDKVNTMTFTDLKAFQKSYIAGKNYTSLIVGDKKLLDQKVLEKYGKVKYLTLEEIFGY
jgi:predicted Zn-dependent peptidase